MDRHSSRLFVPYKALGDVCSSIPPVFRTLHTKRKFTSIICAVDNVVVQYSCEHLRLISISDVLPSRIGAIAADKRFIYAACENKIAVLHLSRQIDRWLKIEEDVKAMLPFGDVLVVVDVNSLLHVLGIECGEKIVKIDSPGLFTLTTIVHPATYMNKILMGSEQGTLRIVNVKTGKLIHEFEKSFGSSISVLEQSPAIDVIAVGLKNGRILLHNIKYDETLAFFKQDAPITSIAFRTDGEETMTSSSKCGTLAVWDLNKRALIAQLSDAHQGVISKIYFLAGEPLMVTAGEDNCLKTWIYDMGDRMPRQLVALEGHSKPLTSVKFVSSDIILSAGLDGSLRSFSVIRDTQRQKLGSAGVMSRAEAKRKKIRDVEDIKLNPIIEMEVGTTREAVWDNVLCRHIDTALVTTWTTRKQSLGIHKFLHKRFRTVPKLTSSKASSLCVSSCGNFGIVGYSSGHIDCFNMQSGLHRKTFEVNTSCKKAHESAVNGLAIDCLNRQLVSTEISGLMRFWDFRNTKLIAELKMPSVVERISMNRSNSLLAVGVGKGSIGIIDVLLRKVVRIIRNAHKAKFTAMDFCPDGKWLVSADEEGLIKVWDLISSSLIDVMKFGCYCTALCFSPSGEYFATCHAEQRSVYLWANRNLFTSLVDIKALPIEFTSLTLALPGLRNSEGAENIALESSGGPMETVDSRTNEGIMQIELLLTLSGLSTARWANLANLDVVRNRNKPIKPLKKPKLAPFFLPSVSTLSGFEFEKNTEENGADRRKMIMAKRNALEIESSFTQSLIAASHESDFVTIFESFKWISISSIDFQLRILSKKAFASFLEMLLIVLRKRRDFELVNSYLAAFMKMHRSELWSNEDDSKEELCLTKIMNDLNEELRSSSDNFDSLISQSSSITQWIKSALL